MEEKILKPYKGFTILKCYDLNNDGTIKKESVVYLAYNTTVDFYDGNKFLNILKKKISDYVGDFS